MSTSYGDEETRAAYEQTRSSLVDLDRRVGEARAANADAVRALTGTSNRADFSFSDCLDLVHEAGSYATVAEVLLQLGHLDAAADTISIGLSIADEAQKCLDGL
jgi:hypothetical protein